MRTCLNLNETGPLKVSTERAGTLSSAANGVLMIQRSLMHSGAHPSTRLTHTRPPNHPHRHMKKHSTLTNCPSKQTVSVTHALTKHLCVQAHVLFFISSALS